MSDIKQIVPYDATQHLVPWTGGVLSPRLWESPSGMAGAAFASLLVGALLGLALSAVESLLVDASGYQTHFLILFPCLMAAISIAIFVIFAAPDHVMESDQEVVKAARDRVLKFGKDTFALKPVPLSLDVVLRDDLILEAATSRPLLFRLDAVLIHLDEALREIGPHEPAIAEAQSVAEAAFVEILTRHKDDLGRAHAGKDVMTRLKASCQTAIDGRIGNGQNVAPTAPTARIGRIVETAEKALAAYPDILDGQGARVDDLVRNHVPRLLQRHADAARTAPSHEVAEVDNALEQGVEDIRKSVEEALARIHDEAMDQLATELRFLSLRRGAPPLLTSVA